MGGLARRAALIDSRKTVPGKGTVRLLIAGPYELLDIEEGKSPAAKASKVVGEAFAALGYDAMMLTPGDVAVLGGTLPKLLVPWAMTPGKVATRTLNRQGLSIGLVFFPEQGKPGERPPDKDMEDVQAEALRLRPKVDVVIGVSPWGAEAEQIFLDRFSTAPAFDVLLGGGFGQGNRGKLAAGGATAWLRPYTKGKAVHVVRVFSTLKRQPQAQAKSEADVRFEVIALDEKITADRAMDLLLSPARGTY
ncbi:MAG: hypothetical protein AB7E46_14480 [Desulfovibrio sp.]